MNLIKSMKYFNPFDVKERIHIIGCGSTGSTIAELLARLGLTKITLYDFDTVETKNVANQMFTAADEGENKAVALKDIIVGINSAAVNDVLVQTDGYVEQPLSGYVFLCADNIDTMRGIVLKNRFNRNIKIMFNTRTTLEECQAFSVKWESDEIENFLRSMEFTHEEAVEASPRTACGEILGVAPSVREICTATICNFINYQRKGTLKRLIVTNPFEFSITAV